MNTLICKAIEERRILQFSYKGSMRAAEPHAFGRQKNGTDAFCAWQLSGGSAEDFRLFHLYEVSDLRLLDEQFEGPRAGYRRGDARFVVMHSQL